MYKDIQVNLPVAFHHNGCVRYEIHDTYIRVYTHVLAERRHSACQLSIIGQAKPMLLALRYVKCNICVHVQVFAYYIKNSFANGIQQPHSAAGRRFPRTHVRMQPGLTVVLYLYTVRVPPPDYAPLRPMQSV